MDSISRSDISTVKMDSAPATATHRTLEYLKKTPIVKGIMSKLDLKFFWSKDQNKPTSSKGKKVTMNLKENGQSNKNNLDLTATLF